MRMKSDRCAQCDASVVKRVVGALAVCVTAGWCSASIIFEAGFNGSGNTTCAAYTLVSVGGSGTVYSDTTGRTTSQVSKDDPLSGGGGYLDCAINVKTSNVSYVNAVTFTPSSTEHSLGAMTPTVDGDRVINGGFDFFFRADTAISGAEMRALDSDNRSSNSGLRFTFGSVVSGSTRGIRLEVISNTGGLLAGGEGGSACANVNVLGAFPMTSNTVYHLGLTFATDADGTVTAKIWAQDGAGAIDLTTASPIASLVFGIDENVVSNGFATGSFIFNQIRFENIPLPMRQDFDRFRIYDAAPAAFGALEDYAWRDSSPQTVLQADFRGAGDGTGGVGDMVTFGGTGTLTDYGTVSDASVMKADPFRTRAGGYLSILTTNNVTSGVYGRAIISPSSDANSLAAMGTVTNGQRVLRGGLDFFFRSTTDLSTYNEFRPIDNDNRSAGGLRLILHVQSPFLMELEILSNDGGLYTDGEGGSATARVAADFSETMTSNTVYHAGISFDTTDDGTVTTAVWMKQGTGAIDRRRDFPIGMLSFGINESVVTNGFIAGSFDFGKLRNTGVVPARQDYDTLRIYNDTPIEFSELPVPPAGTLVRVY